MADLAVQAADWAQRWDCVQDGAAIVTQGAVLWPVRRGGVPLMVKVIAAGSDEAGAAAFLAALGGRGAVRLVQAGGQALLMERVMATGPGLDKLALQGADEAALRVLCGLAGQVHAALRGADLPGLIPLDQRMRALAGPGALPDWVRGLAADMLADRGDWTALHGDLHHFNALHDPGRGWVLIDPKGVLGPPIYDLANCLLNPFPQAAHVLSADRMQRLAGVVADAMGLTAQEVLRWTCLHGCLAAAWDGQDGYWAAGARLAGQLAGLRPPV